MLEDDELFRIFNEWISESTEEVLIDVADYKHLYHGPTTILIGHEANYFLESINKTKGLVYARKRLLEGDFTTRINSILYASLNGCIKLENHPEFQGRLKFDGREVRFTANDRLQAPNTEENIELFKQHLSPALDILFLRNKYTFEDSYQPKERLTVTVRTTETTGLSDLLKNLV